MKIHFLQTVWSDIILLEDGSDWAMIDTGTEEQFPLIRSYLEKRGVRSLRFILLTHFHRDHYGSIPALIDTYPVDRVYWKKYSGLDSRTAWGTEADDAYRQEESEKYVSMYDRIRKKTLVIPVEQVSRISFGAHGLELFHQENSIRAIYEDHTNPDTFHRYAFSENQNSLAALMTVNGRKVFFGGDMRDAPSIHPLAHYVHSRIAQEIGGEIDVYKAPHHGTIQTALPETLAVYRPKIAVLTNGEAFLRERSDVIGNLQKANPDVKIYLTEKQTVAVTIAEGGEMTVEGEELT